MNLTQKKSKFIRGILCVGHIGNKVYSKAHNRQYELSSYRGIHIPLLARVSSGTLAKNSSLPKIYCDNHRECLAYLVWII